MPSGLLATVQAPLADADRAAVDWFVRRRRESLARLAVGLAHLGRGGVLWIAAGAAAHGFDIGRQRTTLRLALGVLAAYAGSAGLARLIGRGRPCHGNDIALIECPDGPGLPSDQVAGAFAGATALSASVPRLALPLYALALSIAAARVYAGVHYPTDVLGGASIGVLAGRAASARAASN
ncbi:MAG: phosphatase PAP2 family protein [Actinomycetota bacterium]|nr:phosphatase PAP2 family protein [Actinomycetota bacterium]